ncbi:nucleoside recognition membrane protein YjiH [Alkalibacillus filiformis]|uniref:Nucleoside recognition membrane protein YjiH n=1 Tax=Alkalibacillus filiformis TaxID=200990 RepID=A0ABU0DVU8_9BACI|nr:YjiH family protein [Alkalibacillus filiformis]MDQ0352589.1 nucleoside recognition membrane protein YjiH [Alkalibacillus filiformis]
MEQKSISLKYHLKFLILSALGIFFFMTPITYGGETSIPVAVLANELLAFLGDFAVILIVLIISISAILSVIAHLVHNNDSSKFSKDTLAGTLFNVGPVWMTIRLLGMIFAILTYFQIGWEGIYSDYTGGLLLDGLLTFLLTVFLFAGLLLPLLLSFGLLELIGALFAKIMRPVFKLPGRSTVDNLTSWFGDGTVGVLLTNQQYEQGYYTKREAAVIGTTFSVVSITFTITIIQEVDLMHMFLPLYGTIFVAGLVAALIMPRIPPLSRIPDDTYSGEKNQLDESIPSDYNTFTWGYRQAVTRAEKSPGITGYMKAASKNILDMWVGVLPIVMAVGTLGLIVAEMTPFFTWIGTPFVPILELMQVPEAQAAAETILIGFTDMFLPALMIESVGNEMTRFIVAALSVVQLIYLSEVGGVLLASNIPINFRRLVAIFLLRTAITLPVIILMAHLIF